MLQSLLRLLYPPQCALCDTLVEQDGGLCGACWREVPFILGLACDQCGAPLPGEDDGVPLHCDDCLSIARPWQKGRAAMIYTGQARKLVLALKHGDRLDLAAPAARWMETAAAPLLRPDQVIVPVPGHWQRTLRRRYNQAAVLGHALARRLGRPSAPLALHRLRKTESQDGKSVTDRFANVADAIVPHPRYGRALAGAHVLLVDDVMTSGATLAAATEAATSAGATSVRILALARVVKDA